VSCIRRARGECCWNWCRHKARGHGSARISTDNPRNFQMLLLATDTSGKNGSIALARIAAGEDARGPAGGTPALLSSGAAAPGRSARGDVEVIEVVPLAGGTFSAQLVPQISALLAKHGFTKNDIDGFVVASGPGSFTGLRVGLAAIKALAEILDKPIAAVSLLEAIAITSGSQGSV